MGGDKNNSPVACTDDAIRNIVEERGYLIDVIFCSHVQIWQCEEVEKWPFKVIQSLVKRGATALYYRDYGAFNGLAASVLQKQKKLYPQIEPTLFLAYINTRRSSSGYDITVYPPLETVPCCFAIFCRNRWIIERLM